MPTVNEIITDAYGEIGVYGPTDTISTQDSSFAIRRLNMILNTWGAQPLMSAGLQGYVLSVAAGQADYTIQPLATRIRSAHILYPGTNPLVYPLEVMSRLDYEYLKSRRYYDFTMRPDTLVYQDGSPTSTLTLAPTPDKNCAVKLWYDSLPSSVSSTADTLNFTYGYYKALMLQLALELAPSFQASISPITQTAWQDAIRTVKMQNTQQQGTPYDPRMPGLNGRFDITTGLWY
jgi:hypothetical protein